MANVTLQDGGSLGSLIVCYASIGPFDHSDVFLGSVTRFSMPPRILGVVAGSAVTLSGMGCPIIISGSAVVNNNTIRSCKEYTLQGNYKLV